MKYTTRNIKHNKIVARTYKDAVLFYDWCIANVEDCIKKTSKDIMHSFYLYYEDFEYYREMATKKMNPTSDIIMCNPSGGVRVWLYYNCPFEFITNQLV